MDNLIDRINKFNDELYSKEKIRLENKEKSFKVIKGKIPIILSAPHTIKQLREGKVKGAEHQTGAIASILAKEIGCFAIYKTYNNSDDANYDIKNNEYKEEIKKIIKENDIKILLDIHGAKDEHGFDIDLGTAYGENINNNIEILEKLKSYFKKYNIENITENKTFKADSIRTISKYINEETKIPCIQLEISCKYRNLDNLDNIERLIKALEEFILNF